MELGLAPKHSSSRKSGLSTITGFMIITHWNLVSAALQGILYFLLESSIQRVLRMGGLVVVEDYLYLLGLRALAF